MSWLLELMELMELMDHGFRMVPQLMVGLLSWDPESGMDGGWLHGLQCAGQEQVPGWSCASWPMLPVLVLVDLDSSPSPSSSCWWLRW